MLRRALTSSSLLETGSLPVHLRTCVFHRFLKDQVLKIVKQNHHYRELIVKPVLKSFRALGTFPWLFSCMDTFVLPKMEKMLVFGKLHKAKRILPQMIPSKKAGGAKPTGEFSELVHPIWTLDAAHPVV